jgi:tetratricopeptide (TPR) repeat protein
LAWRSPQSRFLLPGPAAEWIVYPVPPQTAPSLDNPQQQAIFRGSFELAAAPTTAQLAVRAFSSCSVAINGELIDLPPVQQWNQEQITDVARNLRAGSNEIRAAVVNTNDVGPPVLWLALQGPDWSIRSDERWTVSLDGAVDCPAHLAREPLPIRPGNPVFGATRTLGSLRQCIPELAAFGFLTGVVLFLAGRAARRPLSFQFASYRLEPIHAGLFVALLLWILLLGHNLLSVPLFVQGFDAPGHLNYIKYVQEQKALPLADEGWEMHQPPLYYVLAAGLLAVFGLTTGDPGMLLVLRLMGLAIGLGQLVAVAGCLRLLFPEQPRRQLVGLTLAACLPVHIYLSHYITNESLVMLLGTVAIYFCLRILHYPSASLTQYGLLGLCLGAALLTKITAIVLAGVVILVLVGRLVAAAFFPTRGKHPGPATQEGLTQGLRSIAVTALVMILVSGWHYIRVWCHFGTPLVGNFDAITGYHFWQDPGYGTFDYLFRFGRSLTDPFFSAFNGLADGFYSTLWGDGLCGGGSTWSHRPPWNYDFMAAGYSLALVPAALVLIGLVLAVWELLRRPRAEWFLLLGIGGGLAAALLYQFIRFPYYGHAKAFYELIGMVTACALGGLGLDFVARHSRVLGAALLVLLGTWACTAYLSYWIRPDSAATHFWVGIQQQTNKRYPEANGSFQKAIRADPGSIPARLAQADLFVVQQQIPGARRLYEEILHEDPANPEALFRLALTYEAQGRTEEAVALWQRTVSLAPDHPLLYPMLGDSLARQNQLEAAIAAFRQALRVVPQNPGHHVNLGLLLARAGQIDEALYQYRYAVSSRSNQSSWLADLAWLLATREESRLRQPAEAQRLAMEACERTGQRDASCLQALAAAQAADGQYSAAAQTARRARKIATNARQLQQLQEQIEHCDKSSPFCTRAPLRVDPYELMLAKHVLK